jgi:protein TonB
MNEKRLRLTGLIIAAVLHIVVILFFAVDVQGIIQEAGENARVMKLTDLAEFIPPPPPPPPPVSEIEIPQQVEEITEYIIETDIPPVVEVVAAGTIQTSEDYLPMHMLSTPPRFDESSIMADLIYPPIALRSGTEGNVILELFVDRTGTVVRAIILREDPEGRGFGEAARRAFLGRQGIPATANGMNVSARYRYPVTFRIR